MRKDEGYSEFGTYRGILTLSSLKKAYTIFIYNLTERGYIEDGSEVGGLFMNTWVYVNCHVLVDSVLLVHLLKPVQVFD